MLEKYLFGIILFTHCESILSLQLLGNCTEDGNGQWFTCIKFVGMMKSSECTETCSLNNLNQFSLTDFYNFSDGLNFFLHKLDLDLLYNQYKELEWSMNAFFDSKTRPEVNFCTNVFYNFGMKEWTDGEIGLKNDDFVLKWKNKFKSLWINDNKSEKEGFPIEPYQPDSVVLLR